MFFKDNYGRQEAGLNFALILWQTTCTRSKGYNVTHARKNKMNTTVEKRGTQIKDQLGHKMEDYS
jgi:hypothetical protein